MPRLSNSAGLFGPSGGKGRKRFNDATGGTITTYTSGGKNYRVHTFLSTGTFTPVISDSPFDVMLVAGGYSGSTGDGATTDAYGYGGPGGAHYEGTQTITSAQTVTVGAGAGWAGPACWAGQNAGGASSIGSLRSVSGSGSYFTSTLRTGASVGYASGGCTNCTHTGQGRWYVGAANTGNGGGGSEQGQGHCDLYGTGGGSGIVVIRYEIAP